MDRLSKKIDENGAEHYGTLCACGEETCNEDCFECEDLIVAIEKLAEYEDTGLEPGEVEELIKKPSSQEYLAYKVIKDSVKGCLDREREKDRRIAVLEKALELACAAICRMCGEYDCGHCKHKSKNSHKHLIKQAEAELNGNKTELL